MNQPNYTGLPQDDRRITAELQAMGAFNQATAAPSSTLTSTLKNIGQFITWLRWKGEVSVYGCRVGAQYARQQEATFKAAV